MWSLHPLQQDPMPRKVCYSSGSHGKAAAISVHSAASQKKGQAVVQLDEAEKEMIDLGKVESSMTAAVDALKREFASLSGRITPGGQYIRAYATCTACKVKSQTLLDP